MNQPTEDRLKRLEEEQRQLKEEVRQLKEQMTEPIRIDRLEIDRGGTHKRLDAVQEDTNVLKIEMEGVRADISVVKANQSDMREYIEEQFKSVEAQQEAHTEILGRLVTFAESHDTMLQNTATKDDIKMMATKDDVAEIKATQDERFSKLEVTQAEILALLKAK